MQGAVEVRAGGYARYVQRIAEDRRNERLNILAIQRYQLALGCEEELWQSFNQE